MKIHITLAILIYSISLSETFATGISATTNGVYLVIAGERQSPIGVKTNEPVQFDDRLLWMPFRDDTNQIELTYPGNIEYRIKVKMTDLNGNELPKTTLGNKCGSKWDLLHGMYDSLENIRDARPSPFIVGGSYKDNLGLGGARFLPKPSELFQIKKSGIYTLEIQMQMFYPNLQSTNLWHKDLFQFSPIKIKVEKPKEK
jgi:hypothetical protein